MLAKTLRLYKNAYAGLSRETWLLGLVILINRSGTMVLPFMSIYCTQKLHYSLAQAGIVMGIFGLGAIVGSQLSGKLTDKLGFYTIQIATLLLGGVMFFVVAELEHFYLLCAGVFAMSFFNESFRPANSAAIAHYSKPENRTRSYAVNRLAINLGFSVGAALGGFLAAKNYHLLFWVDGLTNIGASLLMLRLLPPVKPVHHDEHATETVKGVSPFKDKSFMFFIIITFCFGTCFLQLFGMHPVFLKTSWHLHETEIGLLMAMNGLLIVAIEMVLIHSIEHKKNPLYFIRIGMLLLCGGFIILNVLPASFLVAAFSMLFLTVGEMFSLPFMNTFWINRTASNNRGRYAALYTTAWSASHVIAPTIGSAIAGVFGFSALWFSVGVVLLILIVGNLLLEKNLQHPLNADTSDSALK
jgi:predicted MFS family arabinose efflux permease